MLNELNGAQDTQESLPFTKRQTALLVKENEIDLKKNDHSWAKRKI